MADPNLLIIDDRSSGDLRSTSGNEWRLVTDSVMGGVTTGRLKITELQDFPCLRMQGAVSLENNGGFLQATLNLPRSVVVNVANYSGFLLQVYGNNEQYNLHLRTADTTLPWQSYRASFNATPKWQELYIPFTDFIPYRIDRTLNVKRLTRIGVVAIGRAFAADLCVGKIALYK